MYKIRPRTTVPPNQATTNARISQSERKIIARAKHAIAKRPPRADLTKALGQVFVVAKSHAEAASQAPPGPPKPPTIARADTSHCAPLPKSTSPIRPEPLPLKRKPTTSRL